MKFPKSLIFLLTIPVLYNCTGKEQVKDTFAAKKTLLTAIDTFNNAFRTGDIATLETMITDNYQHTNGNSKSIDKTT